MNLSMLLEMRDGSYRALNDNDVVCVIVWHKESSFPVAMVDGDGKIHERPTVADVRGLKRVAA